MLYTIIGIVLGLVVGGTLVTMIILRMSLWNFIEAIIARGEYSEDIGVLAIWPARVVAVATIFCLAMLLILPAGADPLPSYAVPIQAQEVVTGVIQSVNSKYNFYLQDNRGFTDNIQMQQGTIINPRGISLVPGMAVRVVGIANERYFLAVQIDTPYNFYPPSYQLPLYPCCYVHPYRRIIIRSRR